MSLSPVEPTWVYNAICEHGLSLYVGMSRDLPTRISQHRKDKPWWDRDVWAVTADLYPTRDEAAEVERGMISLLHPHRNQVGREPWWMEPSVVLGFTPVDQTCLTSRGKDPLLHLRGA